MVATFESPLFGAFGAFKRHPARGCDPLVNRWMTRRSWSAVGSTPVGILALNSKENKCFAHHRSKLKEVQREQAPSSFTASLEIMGAGKKQKNPEFHNGCLKPARRCVVVFQRTDGRTDEQHGGAPAEAEARSPGTAPLSRTRTRTGFRRPVPDPYDEADCIYVERGGTRWKSPATATLTGC